MSGGKQKIELCAHCRYDGGWHYDEDGNPSRPHHDAAKAKEAAQKIVELAHEEQTKQAREIVALAAESLFEFSANNIRVEMKLADINERAVIGAAFDWAHKQGLIEPTGRYVMSTEPSTRHRINVWRSVKRAAALGITEAAS